MFGYEVEQSMLMLLTLHIGSKRVAYLKGNCFSIGTRWVAASSPCSRHLDHEDLDHTPKRRAQLQTVSGEPHAGTTNSVQRPRRRRSTCRILISLHRPECSHSAPRGYVPLHPRICRSRYDSIRVRTAPSYLDAGSGPRIASLHRDIPTDTYRVTPNRYRLVHRYRSDTEPTVCTIHI